MYPILPIPPKRPVFGINLHGPFIKKSAMPLEAENTEVRNVTTNRRSGAYNGTNVGVMDIIWGCPLINFGCIPYKIRRICACGTLSNNGSVIETFEDEK